MEHTCPSCGAQVSDGVPFCKQCRAPQIRVAATEAIAPSPAYSSIPTRVAAPHSQPVYAGNGPAVRLGGIDWSSALPSVALAGTIAALSLFIPTGLFGLGLFASGYISVALYRRRRPDAPITPAMGACLGAASGGIGFAIWGILFAVGVVVMHAWDQVQEVAFRSIDEAAARNPDPKMQEVASQLKSPEGLVIMVIGALIITLLVFVVVPAVTGLLAARLQMHRNDSGS